MVKGLKAQKIYLNMQYNKYRFSILTHIMGDDTLHVLSSSKYWKTSGINDLFRNGHSYTRSLNLPKRQRTRVAWKINCMWERRSKNFLKTEDVRWEETTYNWKISKVKKKRGYSQAWLVKFTVELTPREAFQLRKFLEDIFYKGVSYKKLS